MTSGVPLLIDLAGRRVVVVGAGQVAAGKLASVLDARADVTVIAPEASASVRAHADAGRLSWRRRPYGHGDLAGALLAVAATDDPAVNERVAADAAATATVCVRSDRAPHSAHPGTAAFLAAVHRGDLLLAVSTGGRAPSLSRRLRCELEETYGPEYGALVALFGELRDDPTVQAGLARLDDDARRAAWRSVPVADILRLLRSGHSQSARELASACLSLSSD